MEIVPKNELYSNLKQEGISLWEVATEDISKKFLNDESRKKIITWIKQINYRHHNEADFFNNLKEIFTCDGKENVILGQEDTAAIRLGTESIVVRNADMGVNFTLYSNNVKEMNENQWKNFEKMLSALEVGFINAKNFHSLIQFDKISTSIGKNNSITNQKIKL